MLDTERDLFFLLFAAGLGLVAAGAVNLLRAARGRAAVVGPAVGLLAAGGAWWACQPAVSGHHALAAGGVLLAAVGGGLVARGRATAGWGLAAACGAGLIGYGAVRYDRAEDRQADADSADLAQMIDRGPTAAAGTATTDAGTSVALHTAAVPRSPAEMALTDRDWFTQSGRPGTAVRRGPAGDGCNCHGWVFTGGRYGVGGALVRGILTDNRYEEVSQPRPGDLVVYLGHTDAVDHTAVVRAVADDGTVLAEGKWGWLGVYLHAVDASPYGTRFSYYRSPRAGHLLKDLPGEPMAGR